MHAYITHEIIQMKSWYHIQISYMNHIMISRHILQSYAWDIISRNHHIWFQVTYDIIVSSMNHAHDIIVKPIIHACIYNTWNHTIWNCDIISRFHIWYYIVIYWYMTSYDWNHMHGIWYNETKTYDFRLPMIS